MTLPSTALAHKFSALVSDEFTPTILPMGFEPPIEARRPRASRNDWLCMGRLVEIKGIDLAIRSFGTADLADATTLHIAGDGPERAALEKLARESLGAGTNRRIEFHGIVAGRAKARLLERCGFALFCSKTLADGRHEGLPVSFLEACARGLIPLSAPIPGLTDYLADPTRQSLQTRRVDAWADAITRLARISPADRLELRAAQKSRVDPLAWPELIARWDALIREIAS
jgi:glycosyltransferase involved in cell wall biosynthesis